MDELTASLAKTLSLTPNEESPVVTNEESDFSLSLIGRVVMERDLQINSIKFNVLRLLQPVKGADFQHISQNTFALRFNHPLDRKNAMEACPWNLKHHALIFSEIDPATPLSAHVVNDMKIVVRAHHFPLVNRSVPIARLIGDNIGRFLDLPKPGSSALSRFYRIKVVLDVRKPLKRGLFFQDGCGVKQWYWVSYERLPTFCFLCGILGHKEVKCSKRDDDGFVEPEGGLPYGFWLKATSEKEP